MPHKDLQDLEVSLSLALSDILGAGPWQTAPEAFALSQVLKSLCTNESADGPQLQEGAGYPERSRIRWGLHPTGNLCREGRAEG